MEKPGSSDPGFFFGVVKILNDTSVGLTQSYRRTINQLHAFPF